VSTTSLRRAALLAGASLLLAGCGGKQSVLDPHSKPTHQIVHLWWGMLAAAGVVFGGALVLLFIAWRRRNREGLPVVGKDEGVSTGMVVGFGIVIPVLALSVLFWVSDLEVGKTVEAPGAGSAQMQLTVIGHQWWWEARYPGTAAVTANEIHIPTKTRIDVLLESTDVIHSFWVPALNKKVDTVPGHPNHMLLYADRAGVFRGQCAEFCGLQHANMSLEVVAQPPAQFRAWLANEARPAAAPPSPEFMSEQCASCHTIRGTPARGTIGPDLTHVGSRRTLAGLAIPNDPAHLSKWIANPQSVKPGARMPGLGLSPQDVRTLTSFLEGLR
jgi:cytochrome c oxidase subunit II